MTLSERNIMFRAGIFIAAAAVLLAAAAAWVVIPALPAAGEAARRAPGIIQSFIGQFLEPNPYAPLAAIAASALYALITLILISYFFEKTQAPEILFFAFFAASFSFEAIRFMAPLQQIFAVPPLYQVIAFRVLLFSRYFGIFALFTASAYAAGLEVQKQRDIFLIITVAALVVVMGVPIDVLSWDSSFSMIGGYTAMFRMIEAGTLLITMVSFFISAWTRGSREYILIGAGSFLVFLGRNILLSADTWLSPAPGLILLALGTWLICTRLHHVYLWL
ncbi:MAG: hypothetical protein LBK27_02920 [Treponema sp.]|jgi:hypothetical protein|nr:hypothetical protein [Treponema sp.]